MSNKLCSSGSGMSRKHWWLWSGLGLLALYALLLVSRCSPIEQDIQARTNTTLTEKGYDWAQATVHKSGRDTLLSGIAPSEAARDDAIQTAASVYGTRTVTHNMTLKQYDSPTLGLKNDDGTTILTGSFPKQALIDKAVRVASDNFGAENVVNRIKLSDDVSSPSWLTSSLAVLPAITGMTDAEFEVDDKGSTLKGTFHTDEEKQSFLKLASEKLGATLQEATVVVPLGPTPEELAEIARKAEEAEAARLAEEKRIADEAEEAEAARLAEVKRLADAQTAIARIAEERRLAAEAEETEAARLAEEKRLADAQTAIARIAEERRLAAETEEAEATRLAEEKRLADAQTAIARIAEERRLAAETEEAEAARLAEVKRLADAQTAIARIAEERRLAAETEEAEAARLAEVKRLANAQAAIARIAEERRLAAEAEETEAARLAEEKRLANAQAAIARIAEERRLAAEAEAAQLAEEQRRADAQAAIARIAEEKRLANAQAAIARIAEERRLAAEAEAAQLAEEKRLEEVKNCQMDINNVMNGNTILFATSSSDIDRKSYPLLKTIATTVRRCGDTVLANGQLIEISGHTDSRGSDEMNLKLSDNRAKSVRSYLLEQGVRSSVLISKGYGEANPIANNGTAAGRKQNRRIQFTIQ